jgi:hypothetical protein
MIFMAPYPPPSPNPGEHMDQFEAFETRRFVGRLLGRGDVSGLMDKIQVGGGVLCVLGGGG